MHRYALSLTLTCSALVLGCSDTQDTTTKSETPTTEPVGNTSSSSSTTSSDSETGEDPTEGEELGQCDPWLQDCPDGFKCMAFAPEDEPVFTGNKCTPVASNPKQVGDPCKVEGGWWTGIDDCDYGLACWNINHADNTGQCVPLCTGNEDSYSCPQQKDLCVFWVPGIAHVCLPSCDPLLQDCDPGQACNPNWATLGQDFVCGPEYSFDEGQVFDPCEFSNACDPGLMCWDSVSAIECDQNSQGCCLPFCDLTKPDCTGQGAECVSFYDLLGGEPAPPHFADVGLCVLPG
jgi:hypothetical protein